MKVKLDENLPESLVTSLASLNHDLDTVRSEGLAGHADSEVWQAAQSSGRFLVTQDLDFSDMRIFAPGTHHGLLLVRLRSTRKKRSDKTCLEHIPERRYKRLGKMLRPGDRNEGSCASAKTIEYEALFERDLETLATHRRKEPEKMRLLQISVWPRGIDADSENG
jgi:predicted nuclease of predicted toxin-antitoxin system